MLDQPLIKILLLVALAVFIVLLTRSTSGSSHQAVRRLALIGFGLVAIVAVMFPATLTTVAQWVGVGRGADLLLYGLTVAFFGYVASSYRRTRRLERDITLLTRELALRSETSRDRDSRDPGDDAQV